MIRTTRRQFTALAAAAAVSPAAAFAEDTYPLKIHSFSGPPAPEAIHMVLPFIEAVEDQSNGRLKVEFRLWDPIQEQQVTGQQVPLDDALDDR